MRRKERAITERVELERIIAQGRVCHLALYDLPAPYVVPLSYGYRNRTLYFHAAGSGHKIDLIRQNPRAGFTISVDLGDIDGGDQGCDWSVRYRSVIGSGRIEFIEGAAEKRDALDQIMAQYAPGSFTYTDAMIERTLVLRLEIDSLTGKAANV